MPPTIRAEMRLRILQHLEQARHDLAGHHAIEEPMVEDV
jgi:hypothetical protein